MSQRPRPRTPDGRDASLRARLLAWAAAVLVVVGSIEYASCLVMPREHDRAARSGEVAASLYADHAAGSEEYGGAQANSAAHDGEDAARNHCSVWFTPAFATLSERTDPPPSPGLVAPVAIPARGPSAPARTTDRTARPRAPPVSRLA